MPKLLQRVFIVFVLTNHILDGSRTDARGAETFEKGFNSFFHPSSNRINLVKMDNNESVFAVFVFNLHTVL